MSKALTTPKKNKKPSTALSKIKCGKCRLSKAECKCKNDKKSGAGRKLFDGKSEEVVLQKLEEAFGWGCLDEEACLYADISPRALYDYQEKNPQFLQRKQLLKEKIILLSRSTLMLAVTDRDIKTDINGKKIEVPSAMAANKAQFVLERKRKSEYGAHSTIPPDKSVALGDEKKQKIDKTMKAWDEPEEGDERDEDYESSN